MPFVSFPWCVVFQASWLFEMKSVLLPTKIVGKKGSSSSHFSYVQLFALLKDFERDIKLQGSK